jgi:hypothetical protein
MKNRQSNPFSFRPSTDCQDIATLFTGRVMDPNQVEEATTSYPGNAAAALQGRWFLCGDVRQDLFERIAELGKLSMPLRVSGFTSPAGATYAVLSHQIDTMCHRFLLPLFEPRVLALFTAVESQPSGFMLGCNGTEKAAVLNSHIDRKVCRPLLSLARPLSSAMLSNAIAELPLVIASIRSPERVPSIWPGVSIETVSVSVIPPDAAIDSFIRTL